MGGAAEFTQDSLIGIRWDQMLIADREQLLKLLADKLGCEKKQVEFIFRPRPKTPETRRKERKALEIPRWGQLE